MHWIAFQLPEPAVPEPACGADAAAREGAALVDPHTALAWWALRFTPLVARVEGALVLEVSGSERLFGGRAALLQLLLGDDSPVPSPMRSQSPASASVPVPVPVHMHAPAPAPMSMPEQVPALSLAQGATSLLALGRLWAQAPDAPIDALPLHSLAAARAHLPTLQRLGCSQWGQLRALPRAGLARRFGAALVDALDRAYGERSELYPWLHLPDVFDAPLELSAAVESAPALLFGARRLLAQLLVWLRVRQHGVLALELLWELDARRSNALHRDAHHQGTAQGRLVLRTAQATQDMQHVQRLLGEQLAQVTLPAPVLYLRLRSLLTQPLAGESHSLLPEDQRKGDSLHQTLERLGARLGREQVLCVQPQAAHQPECMQVWQPWQAQAPGKAATPALPGRKVSAPALLADAALLPTWLLAEPQLLKQKRDCPQYHGPLTLLAGPQRLETGWLEGQAVLRDYFVARSAQAGLLWIYRERLATDRQKKTSADTGLRWFLHGLFA